MVERDPLSREPLTQHGIPRPHGSLGTYDLDVQLEEFAGAHLVATERLLVVSNPQGGLLSSR
jgi:hypothetical protein